jgi:hypothetical protein
MTLDAYKTALTQAKKDLMSKVAEVGNAEEIVERGTKEIVELRQTIAVLAKLCGESPFNEEDELGLTDVIRMAYKSLAGAGHSGVSAQEVKEQVESMGYAGRWANLLASVHTVTNRLYRMGEIQPAGNVNGRDTFRWSRESIGRTMPLASLMKTKGTLAQAAKRAGQEKTRRKGQYGGPPVSEET